MDKNNQKDQQSKSYLPWILLFFFVGMLFGVIGIIFSNGEEIFSAIGGSVILLTLSFALADFLFSGNRYSLGFFLFIASPVFFMVVFGRVSFMVDIVIALLPVFILAGCMVYFARNAHRDVPFAIKIRPLLLASLTYTWDAFAGKWGRYAVFILLLIPAALVTLIFTSKTFVAGTIVYLDAFQWSLLAALFGISFIFAFFIAGYMVRIFRGTQPAPGFTGLADLLMDGIEITIVSLIWFIPIIILGLAEIVIIYVAILTPVAPSIFVFLLCEFIVEHMKPVIYADLAFLGILMLFGILGVIRFARTGSIREGVRFSHILATIRNMGWLQFLLSILGFLGAFVVLFLIAAVLYGALFVPYLKWVVAVMLIPFIIVFVTRYFTLVYEQGAGSAPTSVAPAAEQTGLLQERRRDRVSRLFEGSIRIFRKNSNLLWYSLLIGISQLVIYFLNNVFLVFPDSPGIIGKALLLTLPGTVLWLFLCFFIAVIASYVDVLLSIGVLYTAREITLGGRAGLRESLTFAAQRVRYMYGFILISAMVFFLPRIAEPFFPGSVFTKFNFEWLLGIQIFFMILTYFVIPICAFEIEGLLASMKRSLFWFKQIWIEVSAGVLLYHLLFYLAVSAFLMVYILLLGLHLPAGTWETSLVGAAIVGLTEAILGPLVQLYVFGLYSYAKKGTLPSSFKVIE